MEPTAPEPSMQLLAEAAQNETRGLLNGNDANSDQDDRSSSLSDLDEQQDGSDNNDSQESEEEDTEAETERLEESPQKERKQKQVLLSGSLANGDSKIVEKSLLAGASNRPDTLSTAGQSGSGQEQDGDGAPQTSDISSLGESVEGSEPETNSSSSSRKRKRDNEEEDETKHSLKKVALELANHVADQAEENDPQDSVQRVQPGEVEPNTEEVEVSEDEGEQSSPDKPSDDERANDHTNEAQDAPESNDDDVDMEDVGPEEPDAASTARSEEEMVRKKVAMDMLGKIESNFAMLRDKLFAEKNAQLTDELATMQSENITHPEYLAMVEAIEQLRRDRLKHAQTLYNYKIQALRNRSTANRAQILSQYMQTARELRETALEDIGKEWYQIQRGRRRIDEDESVASNHFTGARVDHVAYHTAYNTEVSILSGIAKYVGFPAAPPVEGATRTEIEEDLRQMGISKQSITITNAPLAAPLNFGRPRPAAEEQFIENTPWANPAHPIHMMNNQRQLSNPNRPTSPFTTPIGQKRVSEAPTGSASTIAAFPSSSLAPTPHSTEPTSNKALINAETPSRPPGPIGAEVSSTDARSHTKAHEAQVEQGSNGLKVENTKTDTSASDQIQQRKPSIPPQQPSRQRPDQSPQTQPDRLEVGPAAQPHAQTGVEVANS